MRLIAKVIRISHAKFHCNRLTSVQYIQDYASLIFGTRCVYIEDRNTDCKIPDLRRFYLDSRKFCHTINMDRCTSRGLDT